MNKTFQIIFLSVAFILITAAFIRPSIRNVANAPQGIPDSVYFVFEKSCIDCHADEGNGMAKGKLNFDKWDSYAPDRQLEKAQDACYVMTKGSMPPAKYIKTNPDAAPNQAEIRRICNWVSQIEK